MLIVYQEHLLLAARNSTMQEHKDYRARLKGGPQVARMPQAKPGRIGKQAQEQNSPNLLAEPCSSPIEVERYFSWLWVNVLACQCLNAAQQPTSAQIHYKLNATLQQIADGSEFGEAILWSGG